MAELGPQEGRDLPRKPFLSWRLVLWLGLFLAASQLAAQLTHHLRPRWLPIDPSAILEWIAFFLGLVAVAIATKTDEAVAETFECMQRALIGVRQTSTGIEQALAGIETWALAMPTRQVGPFPEHLDEITRLVNDTNAGGRLDIIADCADYGSFYDPLRYSKLQAALATAKSRGVMTRYLACGPLHRFTANSPYFDRKRSELTKAEREDFEEKMRIFLDVIDKDKPFRDAIKGCLQNQSQRDVLVEWLTIFSGPETGKVDWRAECIGLLRFINDSNSDPSCLERFDTGRKLDFLLFVREWFNERTLTNLGTVKRHVRPAPLFMWLRDAEAVFVLPSPKTRGFGFRTLDTALITSFSSTFEHYWTLDPDDNVKDPYQA